MFRLSSFITKPYYAGVVLFVWLFFICLHTDMVNVPPTESKPIHKLYISVVKMFHHMLGLCSQVPNNASWKTYYTSLIISCHLHNYWLALVMYGTRTYYKHTGKHVYYYTHLTGHEPWWKQPFFELVRYDSVENPVATGENLMRLIAVVQVVIEANLP